MKIPDTLPWKIGGIVSDMSDDGDDDLIVESKSLEICQVFGGIIPAMHDAEYIVHACNNYPKLKEERDELIEALEEYRDAEWMVTHDWGGDRMAILDKVDELLKRAKP